MLQSNKITMKGCLAGLHLLQEGISDLYHPPTSFWISCSQSTLKILVSMLKFLKALSYGLYLLLLKVNYKTYINHEKIRSKLRVFCKFISLLVEKF